MLDKMGFTKILDGIFSSAHLGHKKPAKEFFVKVMRELPVAEKNKVLFWDNQQKNVDAAREFGFKAELYTTFAYFKAKIRKYVKCIPPRGGK